MPMSFCFMFHGHLSLSLVSEDLRRKTMASPSSKRMLGNPWRLDRLCVAGALFMSLNAATSRLTAWSLSGPSEGCGGSSSRLRTSRGLQSAITLGAKLDDLDGVVLVPMEEDDVAIEDMKPPPLPELKVKDEDEKREYPALDGFSPSKPRIDRMPGAEGLEDGRRSLTGEAIATEGLELVAAKAKPGRNKRWLKGRGTMKRKKLEENAQLEKWLGENGVWVSESADWGRPSSGRGLVARRDVECYEDLAQVPYNLLLTKDTGPKGMLESMMPGYARFVF
eukprot:g5189.t1